MRPPSCNTSGGPGKAPNRRKCEDVDDTELEPPRPYWAALHHHDHGRHGPRGPVDGQARGARDAQTVPTVTEDARDEMEQATAALRRVAAVKTIPAAVADKALGVAVFGNLVKGAFIVGGTGGDGVFMRKTATGWGAPAFVNLAGASVGAQIGGSKTDAVFFFMDQASIDALSGGKFEFGTSITAVAGPATATAETLSTSITNKVFVYSKQEGLFAGASADGTTIQFDNEENKAVYGAAASELIGGKVGTRRASKAWPRRSRRRSSRPQATKRSGSPASGRVGVLGRRSSLSPGRSSPWLTKSAQPTFRAASGTQKSGTTSSAARRRRPLALRRLRPGGPRRRARGHHGRPARQRRHRPAMNDGAPFDSDGPGKSDLDLTLVGADVVGLFSLTGFFVPGIHSRPLSDEDPDIAPSWCRCARS